MHPLNTDLEAAFAAGGECGRLLRGLRDSAVGAPQQWSCALQQAVMQMLASPLPQVVVWGPQRAMLYNDAYRPITAHRHPESLGRPVREVFAEAYDAIAPLFDAVDAGEPINIDQMCATLAREEGGFVDVFQRAVLLPIREGGGIPGVYLHISDITRQVVSERRLDALQRVGLACGAASTVPDVCERAIQALAQNAADVPAAWLYLRQDDTLRLMASHGAQGVEPQAWSWQDGAPVPLPDGLRVDDIGVAPQVSTPTHALMVALPGEAGQNSPGYLVVVTNPRVVFDDSYRTFINLAAAHVGAAVARTKAWQATRARADALAALNQAKTHFFHNVSHEFRTPLTLILNPIQDAVEAGRDTLRADDLRMVHRNTRRLLKLVNNLLDVARVEAEQARPVCEPTDLAAYTRELAANFESTATRAGIDYTVDCAPLPTAVLVDREMWEKIVLNLLSNAFKHTHDGSIALTLAAIADGIALEVRDTGCGIAAADLPRVFDRSARAHAGEQRGAESSGVGLSLVRALARLHGGDAVVQSAPERGSVFTVTLPCTCFTDAAIPPLRASERAGAYANEALDDTQGAGVVQPCCRTTAQPACVLVVEDNADMRSYLARVLGQQWCIATVRNGAEALAFLRTRMVDVVVSDIMMPELDGLDFLSALRCDPRTQALPVILLSARGGEASTVKGFEHGADDYLEKPFSNRELVARVQAHLALSALRRDVAAAQRSIEEMRRNQAWTEQLLDLLPTPVTLRARDSGEVSFANRAAHVMAGGRFPLDHTVANEGRFALTDEHDAPLAPDDIPIVRAARGELVRNADVVWHTPAGRFALSVSAAQLPASHGREAQIAMVSNDVTALRAALQARDEFVSVAMHELRTPLTPLILRAGQLRHKLSSPSAPPDFAEGLQKGVADIGRYGLRLDALINDFIDMARLSSGPLELAPRPIDLHALVQTVLDAMRSDGTFSLWPCDMVLDAQGDTRGVWDPYWIGRMVRSLLANAAKFGDRKPVRVSLRNATDGVTLAVQDDGIGIAPEHQTRIFERFERGVSTRHYGGLGLGLWMAQRVVEACDGAMQLESALGEGATFEVRLPHAQ